MSENANLWLAEAKNTHSAGASLVSTLYDLPLTIALFGPLGSGKTTFLQGFAAALSISDLRSPTYALEQRYVAKTHNFELLHLDLYRLSPDQARALTRSSDDFPGVRCIEWAQRIADPPLSDGISFVFSEEGDGRRLHATFADIPLPSREEIHQWRCDVRLPENVVRHCDAVGMFAEHLAGILLRRGLLVRPLALRRAGEVHDLFRFLDFRRGSAFANFIPSPEDIACWKPWQERYSGLKHEPACAAFLRERGFHALAAIVEVHGLTLPPPKRRTTEQKTLFYADKRVKIDEVVTLEERFQDFCARYDQGRESEQSRLWLEEAKGVERALFSTAPTE